MKLTQKQSFYLSLIQRAQKKKQSIREVAEQNNVSAPCLYAAVRALREKGALGAATKSSSGDFVKLSIAPPLMHEPRLELKTQLPNGQPLWLSIAEEQLPGVLRILSA